MQGLLGPSWKVGLQTRFFVALFFLVLYQGLCAVGKPDKFKLIKSEADFASQPRTWMDIEQKTIGHLYLFTLHYIYI